MLPVQQARNIFNKAYLAAYKEIIPVPSFLKSFFGVKTFDTKTVSIEVQRGTERIAVDVLRGTDGNRNTFSRSTEKEFMPPFYSENFDATSLDRYDRIFGSDSAFTPKTIGYLASDVALKLSELRNKIDRAKELQCSQVFETGTVELINGDAIDFKRKAGSKVDVSTADKYWNDVTADVEGQLIAAAQFIRSYGKSGVPTFNIVMSGSAWVKLKNTNYIKNYANYEKVSLLDINMPQTQAFGSGYMGRISAGAYIFNVWTYDEVYEAANTGVITRYWPEDMAFVVPTSGTRFELVHAGVPAIIRDIARTEFPEYITNQASEYWVNNYIDAKAKSHTFEIMSAPLAIPVTVDMIYTMTVIDPNAPVVG